LDIQQLLGKIPRPFPTPPLAAFTCLSHAFGHLWGDPAADIASSAAIFKRSPSNHRLLQAMQILNCQRFITYDGPVLLVPASLTEELDATDVLSSIRGQDLNIVYPSMLLVFETPYKTIADNSFSYGLASFYEKGEANPTEVRLAGKPINFFCEAHCRYLITTVFWDQNEEVSSSSLPMEPDWDDAPDKSFETILQKYQDTFFADELRPKLPKEEEESIEVSRLFVNRLIQINLILQAYPEMIQASEAKGRRSFRLGAGPKQPGRHIRLVSQPQLAEGNRERLNESQGCHVSRHVRRGHWRRQPHSKAWEAANPEVSIGYFPNGDPYHMTWLRPMFVGSIP